MTLNLDDLERVAKAATPGPWRVEGFVKRGVAIAKIISHGLNVADAANLTKSHVWEIENGRSRNPTIAAVHGLSKATGVPFLRLAQAALNSRALSALNEGGPA